MNDLKKQFIDKITHQLIESAATMIADLLGVGIVNLIARGVHALAKIIKYIYEYTTCEDKHKPRYIGKIVGEVVKFVINSLKKKKRKFRKY